MSCCKKPILLFETIKIEDKIPQNIEFHIKRAQASISKNLKFDIKEVLQTSMDGLLRAKLIYDEDGNFKEVDFSLYKKRKIHSLKYISSNLHYEKKYLDRTKIDMLFAMRGSCDEILIIKNGFVSDTSIANIAAKFDDMWYTPKNAILEGTTRQRLLKDGFLKEMNFSIDELKKGQKFAMMNAMIGFDERCIKSFDGETLTLE